MFTGLIEEVAKVTYIKELSGEKRFTIAYTSLQDIHLGESIALNGVCLTVEAYSEKDYTCFASRITLKGTILGNLSVGDTVNIERALLPTTRLGGHFVTGHIDGVVPVVQRRMLGNALSLSFALETAYLAYVIPKGSIALNGISLTIATIEENIIEVIVIPETQKHSTIAQWNVGEYVNIEYDIFGKYIARCMKVNSTNTITEQFLQNNGFI